MGTLPHRRGTQGGCPAFATGSAMENYLRWGAAGPRDRFSLSRKKVRIPFFMFAKGSLEWMTLPNFDFEANFTVLDCLHLDSCWVVCPGYRCLILLIVLAHPTTIGWQIPLPRAVGCIPVFLLGTFTSFIHHRRSYHVWTRLFMDWWPPNMGISWLHHPTFDYNCLYNLIYPIISNEILPLASINIIFSDGYIELLTMAIHGTYLRLVANPPMPSHAVGMVLPEPKPRLSCGVGCWLMGLKGDYPGRIMYIYILYIYISHFWMWWQFFADCLELTIPGRMEKKLTRMTFKIINQLKHPERYTFQ